MENNFKIACVQTEPKPDFESALTEIFSLSSQAINEGAKFIALPEYCGGLMVEENRRYWKIIGTNGGGTSRSVKGFICKAGDKKFREGDMLKAAGWAAPARNFARGNVLDGSGVDNVRWTGIG